MTETSQLPVSAVLAAVPVRELERATPFYEQLFGRPADARPMPGLAVWNCGSAGTFMVVVDADRAGGGLASLAFTDLTEALVGVRERGMELDADAGKVVTAFTTIEDPDGNSLTLVED